MSWPWLSSLMNPSYPSYIEVLLQALNIWYHDPTVTTPILKFIAELVLNRQVM